MATICASLPYTATASASPPPPPAPSVSGPTSVCTGQTATFTASVTPATPTVKFRWFQEIVLGIYAQQFEGNPYTTGALLLGANYYVISYDTLSGLSSTKTYFSVSVNLPNIDVVVATPSALTLCNGDSTTLTATSTLGNTTFQWYDALAGGNLLYTGNPYHTGPLTTLPSVYVQSLNGNGCPSPRILAVPPVVLPALNVPLVTPLVATICNGQSASFTASALIGGTTFNWYDSLLNGNLLFTGNPFTTNATTNPGVSNLIQTYYVDVQDTNGCKSLRTPAIVTVLPALDVPLVNPLVASACNGDSVTFTASALLGNLEFYWFDSLLGGSQLYHGNPYTFAITNNGVTDLTTIRYVEVRDVNGCSSLRTPATVVTLPSLALPLANPIADTVCNGGTATFIGTSLLGAGTYHWYDALTNGNELFVGDTFNHGPIGNPGSTELIDIVYLEVQDTNGCRSLRTPATTVVLPALEVPIVDPLISSVCSGDSATFLASSLLGTGMSHNWYDALINGNQLYSGNPYTMGAGDNTTDSNLVTLIYVEAVDARGCTSLRTPATIVTLPALDLPVVTPPVATSCSADSVTFTASALLGGTTINWYDALTGGNLLATGNSYTVHADTNTGALSLTQMVYAEVVDSNGCKSLRAPATVIVLPTLNVPIVDPLVSRICSGDQAEFNASTLIGTGLEYYWYDSLIGGTLLHTGSNFITPTIQNSGALDLTQLYYVEVRDGNGCSSLRTPATVLVTPALAVPLAMPLVQTICNGDSAEYTATSLLGFGQSTFNWYDSNSGGTLLHVGDTFNTGAVHSAGLADLTRIYFVEVQDNDGCRSLRTPVTLLITIGIDVPVVTPPIATICDGGSADFTANSLLGASTFRWYDALTGGNLLATGASFNTGTIQSTGVTDLVRTFYVSAVDTSGCESLRVPAVVAITPALAAAVALPPVALVCNGDSAEFTALGVGLGLSYNWYDAISAGNLLYSGDTFNTGALNNTGTLDILRTYYLEAQDSNGCKSVRTPVVATITPALAVPIVNNIIQTVCNGQSAVFTATTLLGNTATYKWYDALTGGNLLYTGDTFTTDPLTNPSLTNLTHLYYVEAIDSNGCVSLRTPADATVLPALEVPLVNPLLDIICNGQSAEFVATSLLGTGTGFRWYDAILNGNLLFTGDTFNTGAINNSSTLDLTRIYYVESVDSLGCASLRTPATVVVRPALVVPLVNPLVDIICNGQSGEFTATALLATDSTTFNWYDDLLAGNLLYTGDTFNTGAINNNGTLDLTRIYYVEAVDSAGCKSVRTPATVVVRPALDVPIVMPPVGLLCSGTSGEFIATSLLNPSAEFNWYDSLIGGTPIYHGDTFNTGVLNNPTLVNLVKAYFVESVDSLGCVSIRVPLAVTVLPGLQIPVILPVAPVCNGSSATLVANGLLVPGAQFQWYDSLTSTTPIFTGDTFVTGPLFSNGPLDLTRDYYVESVDSTGCHSLRVPVIVTLIPSLNVPLVNPPLAAICSGTSTSFKASSLLGSVEFYWYDSINGKTPIFIGDSFSTGPIANPNLVNLIKTYYVETQDSNGCTSLRIPVIITVTSGLNAPVVNPITQTICSGDSATFSANSLLAPVTSYRWYDALIGGTLLHVGDTFNTGAVIAGGTLDITRLYFVESYDSIGCTSVRTPATLIITPNPDAIILAPQNTTICAGDSTQITAISVLLNTQVNWYLSPSGGTPIFTGNLYSTGALSETTTYFVSSNSNLGGCESQRYPVTIAVNPVNTLAAPDVTCERVDNNTIRFSWPPVQDANGYEVSTDNGVSWKLPSGGAFATFDVESRTSAEQKGVSLIVRAINRTNNCAPREGNNSDEAFCTFFEKIDSNYKPNNAFSPNGDGANDVWIIGQELEFYPKNTVTVFNRWGKEVFRTRGYNNKDNVFDAKGLDDGSYFYVITIPEVNVELTGYVMVIR